jgi:hypothetical protein
MSVEHIVPEDQRDAIVADEIPRGRRRRPRLLASGRRGMAPHARPALMGTQDRQCAEQAAEQLAIESQAGAAGNLEDRDQAGCACRVRRFRRDLRRPIPAVI